jgi:hypothetical protein
MDLFLREAADRIGADDVLRKIDRLMKWQSFLPILKRGFRTIQGCISVPIQTRGGSRRVQRALWGTRALPAPTKRALSPGFTQHLPTRAKAPHLRS